jgi:uncharacterized membrane protein
MQATNIAILWLAFLGTHLVLSHPPVRSKLVARVGEGPFSGLYSLVALALFVPLVYLWWTGRHTGELLWWWRTPTVVHVAEALTIAGFFLTFGGLVRPPPSFIAARFGPKPASLRGMVTITRHPVFMGLSLWALAHVLVNGWASDVAFFAGFILTTIAGSLHQDWRKGREDPSYADVVSRTGFLPFEATLRGRGLPRLGTGAWIGGIAGIAVAVVLRVFHARLFG